MGFNVRCRWLAYRVGIDPDRIRIGKPKNTLKATTIEKMRPRCFFTAAPPPIPRQNNASTHFAKILFFI